MRLTPQKAGDMCLLTAHPELAQKGLGIDTIPELDGPNAILELAELEVEELELIMDDEE